MIKALVSDFSRVVIFPKEIGYQGRLNALYNKISQEADYYFWAYFELNQELVDFYKSISDKVDMYIFTAEYIQDDDAVKEKLSGIFKNIFRGADLGLDKSQPVSYITIADKIGFRPDEMIYLDDNQENIDAAKEAGFKAVLYESNMQVIENISRYLVNN